MKIKIDSNKKISIIQKEFNKLFPFLKIEFFGQAHKTGGGTHKSLMIHAEKKLSECGRMSNSGFIELSPEMSVSELEKKFHDEFGLNVQVFRKSGKIWLETTVTDNWTLEKQNQQGEELSKGWNTEREEAAE